MDGQFEFTVGSPVKIEGQGVKLGYWKYRVDTKTTFSNYTQTEYGSYRRYSDFIWLRKSLVELNPGCLVPPLPEKDMREGFDKLLSMSKPESEHSSLHEFRRRALRKFLVRVGAHPKLATSTCLQEFIELDEDQFEKRMKATHPESVFKQGSALKQFTLNISLKFAKDIEALNPKAAGESTGNVSERDKWTEVQKGLVQHEGCFVTLRDRFEALAKKRRMFATEIPDLAKSFAALQAVEQQHNQVPGAEPGWHLVSQGLKDLSTAEVEHQTNEVEQVTESLTYYASLCRAAQGVSHYIKQLYVLKDVVADDLANKRKKREKAATPDAQKVLDEAIVVGIQKQEDVDKLVHSVVTTFEEELQRFDLEKQHDFKSILSSHVELTKEYSGKRVSVWKPVHDSLSRLTVSE
eukprot:TRINITY_DN15132_c0_g5_i2.p1 TRINITY_DN15132_c0_g5~~TRINITY_DN15132_c0_g5_i2.p1  ORF type:complete len:407 (+),score=193.70 TRINITY_DN15132_c0_g5_i2:137-1357(+)